MTMKLSDQDITEFQVLYKGYFGKDISKAEARERGLQLIRLYESTSKLLANIEACKRAETKQTLLQDNFNDHEKND